MATDTCNPGMAILLTHMTMNLVFFPFYSVESLANDAISLKEMSLTQLESALNILTLVTSSHYYSNPIRISLIDHFLPIHKSFQLKITTEQDRRVEKLEEIALRLEKESKE